MSTEEKFRAAVNVIRNLPKNGSYQPSTELMLRFYSYYKQATLGPCTESRPAFYNVVARKKYDVWKALGDMPKLEAMQKYVEELHNIVETMSYSENVAGFLQASSEHVGAINMDDFNLIAGDVVERFQNLPLGLQVNLKEANDTQDSSPARSYDGYDLGDRSDDEEFTDAEERINNSNIPSTPKHVTVNSDNTAHSDQLSHNVSNEFYAHITATIQALENDVQQIKTSTLLIEKQIQQLKLSRKRQSFPFPTRWMLFIIVWPFISQYILHKWTKTVRQRKITL